MNTVKVRNLELGSGIPAVCIPNVGKTKEEILSLTEQYKSMSMDLMEWRVDLVPSPSFSISWMSLPCE